MSFFLGGTIDDAGQRTGEVRYESDHLTTHGVVVGMTGSGKTGMALVLLEEALRAGIPVLAIDPKGDLGNLALSFPGLSPAEFEPWVDTGEASREGITPADLAAKVATKWRDGLGGWGLGPADVAAFNAAADVTVFTPGSTAGVPVNVLGSLSAPSGADWDRDGEALRDEIAGLTAGLLGLIGVDADPLTSREHILISNLIERAWRAGKGLDLPTLIAHIQQPPLRKLGVFDLDTFFPPRNRLGLAMRINGLVANPGFATWLEGEPLDVEELLYGADGRPRASVFYLSHLSAEERQFVVTLLLSRVVTWMQQQPGTSALRALIYMDEVFGFVPPSANPPAKRPILTILKQARAFGVGLVLATQNPVDLDYKAMSNAGTWVIGRLQTERDKARILEALQSAGGGQDPGKLDALLSGLGSRRFLLHDTKEAGPIVFETRWALSYLRGPFARGELSRLKDALPAAGSPEPEQATATEGTTEEEAPLAADESPVAPEVADGVPVYTLDPAAEWAEIVGAEPGGKRLEACLALRVHLLFDERKADLEHTAEWEAIYHPLRAPFDAAACVDVDHDPRDFQATPPEGARFVIPEVDLNSKAFFKNVVATLKKHLHRNEKLVLFRNSALKLYSRVGEEEEAFAKRCDKVAQERADADTAKLRDRFEKRLKTLERSLDTAERQLDRAKASQSATDQDNTVSGLSSVLGVFLGGRSSTRGVAKRALRAGRRLSGNRARSARGASRVDDAEKKIEDKEAEIEDLENDLLDKAGEIDARWAEKATGIEPFEVGLEKSDIEVDQVALVWIPTG